MKKALVLLIIIISVFTVSPAFAAAKEHKVLDVTFTVSDEYKVYKKEDVSPQNVINGFEFAAISKDEKHQIQLRCTTTQFSNETGSFYGVEHSMVIPVAKSLFEDNYDIVTFNNMVYIKNVSNSGTVIYVTVYGKKLYTFSYFGNDASKIGKFMSGVSFPALAASKIKVAIVAVLIIFILAALAFLYLLIRSFVNDYNRHKMETSENIVSQYIKIKRRKY